MWYGWESGPISSKHYAHVTPQKGHFAWMKGWGPNGQQELWQSDLYGFAPETDAWWSENGVPGAAGHGENTWLGTPGLGYHPDSPYVPEAYQREGDESPHHEASASPAHRRLRAAPPDLVRP